MPKTGNTICPDCGGSNIICLGGLHYVQLSGGMGDKKIETGYQCKDCKRTWTE